MLFDHCFHYGLSSRAQTVVAIVSKRGASVAVAPRLKATRKVFLGYDRIDSKNDTHQNPKPDCDGCVANATKEVDANHGALLVSRGLCCLQTSSQ